MKIIILAGGAGQRLWPLSRENHPKQFVKFFGMRDSLFQKTLKRSLLLACEEDIHIVTNIRYRQMVLDDIKELGLNICGENIISEPAAKNTLPAIYACVSEIRKKRDDVAVVFPTDHMIKKEDEFAEIINGSTDLAQDSIITFGISPSGPCTGYGYIAPGGAKDSGFEVMEFCEKPDGVRAAEYIEKGYLWNAGIFMFRTDVFAGEVKRHAPDIYEAFGNNDDIDGAYGDIRAGISIDYGIMEKSSRVAVVPVDIGWDDLGSFDSFHDVFEKDEQGNICDGDRLFIDSTDNLVSPGKGKRVIGIGVSDLIIIDTEDTLLICRRGESQRVREAVDNNDKANGTGRGGS